MTKKTKRHVGRRNANGTIEVPAGGVSVGDEIEVTEICTLSSMSAYVSSPDQLAKMRAGLPVGLVKHIDQILSGGAMMTHTIMGYEAPSRTAVWFISMDGRISCYTFPAVESIDVAQEISAWLNAAPMPTLDGSAIANIYLAVTGHKGMRGAVQ